MHLRHTLFLGLAATALLGHATLASAQESGENGAKSSESKSPLKKIEGNWSWLSHNKNGCDEVVYKWSANKEDIYHSADEDAASESDAAKPAKASHRVNNLSLHFKDGVVYMIRSAKGRQTLAAYTFIDDDTLERQIIFNEGGHAYNPETDDMPKWKDVSVQASGDELMRCADEATDMGDVGSALSGDGSTSAVQASEESPASSATPTPSQAPAVSNTPPPPFQTDAAPSPSPSPSPAPAKYKKYKHGGIQ